MKIFLTFSFGSCVYRKKHTSHPNWPKYVLCISIHVLRMNTKYTEDISHGKLQYTVSRSQFILLLNIGCVWGTRFISWMKREFVIKFGVTAKTDLQDSHRSNLSLSKMIDYCFVWNSINRHKSLNPTENLLKHWAYGTRTNVHGQWIKQGKNQSINTQSLNVTTSVPRSNGE